jgi:putative SOS response-associated peptidase YedK
LCGRFGLFATPELLEEYFGLAERPEVLAPRYNIAPGQVAAVVREREGRRSLDTLRWGLVPHWAKDPSIGHRLVNARLDGLATKPAFRDAWGRRRCLVPASGFYEWAAPVGGRKRPHFAVAEDDPLLALAGLWERWRGPKGESRETFVVVTVPAQGVLAPIHDRMPLLVQREAQALWLDPSSNFADVAALADTPPAVAVHPVGFDVNDARNDGPSLVEPLAADGHGGERA